ncbi:MAG TPA: histone deacetylase [Thermoanaerobaculia bacterium]|nr:histone deacetylase [Thermoanaerobaculia bacterium]
MRLAGRGRVAVELVYSRRYGVELPGAAADPLRGERILTFLTSLGLTSPRRLHAPPAATYRQLRQVHTEDYIDSLLEPGALLRIVGLDLPDPLPDRILEAQRLMVGGTILAARLALERGIAINLGGGLHHAYADHGERFCLWNDVAIAIRELRAGGFAAPVLVVDFDLHDGDGTRAIFADDPTVHVLSIHNQTTPGVRSPGATLVELAGAVADAAYLAAIEAHLPPLLASVQPGLVVYLAGCDPAHDDALGDWQVSDAGMLARDRFVVLQVRGGRKGKRTPLAITLAGGYGHRAWTYSARAFAWLLSGREVEPPSSEEMTLARYRALAARIAPHELTGDGAPGEASAGDWGLTPEDLAAAGGMRPRTRFLGFYTPQGLELALERSGLLDRLRARGFPHLALALELDNPGGETVRVRADGVPEPLIEARARIDRGAAPEMALLRIEWLLLQDPRARFTPERPRLPGQRFPGLGLLPDVMALLVVAGERLHLDGVIFVPAHYHTAAQGRRILGFLSPEHEGLFRALAAALAPFPLAEATAAVEEGRVVDAATGKVLDWQPMAMVLPITGRLRERLADPGYEALAQAASHRSFAVRPAPARRRRPGP